MTTESLQKYVYALIRQTDSLNQQVLGELRNRFRAEGERLKVTNQKVAVIDAFKDVGISDSTIKMLAADNFQFFTESYVGLHHDALTHPLFTYALFMDNDELEDVRTALRRIIDNGTENKREALADACETLLRVQYGASAREIKEATLGKLTELITGLPSQNELFRKLQINDIPNIADSEFIKIVEYIDRKYQELQEISGNPRYFFRSDGRTYYWVPQTALP